MAVLSRDRIVDKRDSLLGQRARTWPIVCVVGAALELVSGLWLVAHASARGVPYVLVGVCFATLAAASSLPAVVDARGVRPLGRPRRVPWEKVAAISRPNNYEGSVVIVLGGGQRLQTGFPVDMLPRVAALRDADQGGLAGL